jgi:hypothetical protein
MLKPVRLFLLLNGFTPKGPQEYTNGKCTIKFLEDSYEVTFEMDGELAQVFSANLNIYWLIGVLTYYNLIPRQYQSVRL